MFIIINIISREIFIFTINLFFSIKGLKFNFALFFSTSRGLFILFVLTHFFINSNQMMNNGVIQLIIEIDETEGSKILIRFVIIFSLLFFLEFYAPH